MKRLGLNLHSYQGERIDIDRTVSQIASTTEKAGWQKIQIKARPGVDLDFYHRPASRKPGSLGSAKVAYISAGIHGDEPAGPLAMLTLLRENQWPEEFDLWVCPCLNPTGFRKNTRENDQGIDLNRDYRHRTAAEVRAHLEWLESLPKFDVAFCLHEDWEANGFYCYELNPDAKASCAEAILKAVTPLCPIETASMIDGRESDGSGIMRPSIDPAVREHWPEAFYLLQRKTRLSYTLEAPSDFHLPTRVAALVEAVRVGLRHQAGI